MADEPTVTSDSNHQKQEPTTTNHNAHRPLHITKSSPMFRSMEFLEIQRLEFEGKRSRSSSAPLSAEAVSVARELCKASDIFVRAKHCGKNRKRRSTLGSIMANSIQKEVAQAIKECDEYPELSVDLGTPV